MRVHVQQRSGEFPNVNYYQAWLGFQELGYEVSKIEEAGIEALSLGPEAMLVAEIPFMLRAFARLEIEYRPLPYLPAGLQAFTGRRTWTSTLGEVRESVAKGNGCFAKPREDVPRRFKGQVLRSYRDLIRTAGLEPDFPVWCSELVEIVSEYRAFVCRREIVGCKHYSGDFRVSVDWQSVDAALAEYVNCPAGFGLDFGITADGRTLIVEQNDGFSIGAYGLHPVVYANLLEARWSEICGALPQ